jgi:hypothetical protein
MKTFYITAALIFGALAVGVAYAGDADRVQVLDHVDQSQCQFVGRVEAHSMMTGVLRHAGYEKALKKVLQQADDKNGNVVVLDGNSKAAYWTTSEVVAGQAYRCGAK